MAGATGLPLWAIALTLAVIAPFAARALAAHFERRVRERSRRLLSSPARKTEDDVRGSDSPDSARYTTREENDMARLFGLIGNRTDLAGRVLGHEADALRVQSRGSGSLGWGIGFYQ